MKASIILLAIVFGLVGCGGNKVEKKSETTQEQVQVKSEESKKLIAEGMQYLKQNEIRKAIMSFDNAIKTNPTDPENYIVLGQIYLRLKNFDRAIDTFTAATKVGPRHGGAQYFLATAHLFREDKVKALEAAKKSAEIFMQERDHEGFKRAAILLKKLSVSEEGQQQEG